MLIALAITIAVLLYDLHLFMSGQETISGHIWDRLQVWKDSGYQGRFPIFAILLPAGVWMQGTGLLVHLIAGIFK
jgi:hypothetical protein